MHQQPVALPPAAAAWKRAPQQFQCIWKALQLADYKKDCKLNDAALSVLLKHAKQPLFDLLQARTPDDLLCLFDEDQDGALNADEQLLIFSTIKQRLEEFLSRLCEAQEYTWFTELTATAQKLHKLIALYKDHLVADINATQINEYMQESSQKLQNFH